MDVTVIDSCRECYLRWLEGIVGWEVDVQEEYPSSVWRFIGAHDCRLPSELVFLVERTSGTVSRWVFSKINEFLLDAFECHFKVFREITIIILSNKNFPFYSVNKQ